MESLGNTLTEEGLKSDHLKLLDKDHFKENVLNDTKYQNEKLLFSS